MVERLYKKGLVVGIIVLLIGFGSQSVFAVEDNISSESLTIDNENLNTKSRDVYENKNCFVIGFVGEALNRVSDDNICIGWALGISNPGYYPGSGWIYTDGTYGKKIYRSHLDGDFYGTLGTIQYVHWYTKDDVTHFIAVKGFRGLALGARDWLRSKYPTGGLCLFIGYADHVSISYNQPPPPPP